MALPRRPFIALALLVVVVVLLVAGTRHEATHSRLSKLDEWLPSTGASDRGASSQYNRKVRGRVRKLQAVCNIEDEFERMYGRTNLRLTRGYEGSLFRVEEFVNKILRGENVTVAALGGSITAGHLVEEHEAWIRVLADWIDAFFPLDRPVTRVNGGLGATGSGYFSYCFGLHIPQDADLVVIELGVNDEPEPTSLESMEMLLRGVLSMPKNPAAILGDAMAFSMDDMSGGGGRFHLPVAQYYDVPVINQRHPLVNHFARFPDLLKHYFAYEFGEMDTRHLGARGHRDFGYLMASLLRDTACSMVAKHDYFPPPVNPGIPSILEEQAETSFHQQVEELYGDGVNYILGVQEHDWPEETRSWDYQPPRPEPEPVEGEEGEENSEEEQEPKEELPLPPIEHTVGMWQRQVELGMLPRLMALDKWDPDLNHRTAEFHPVCYSTRTEDERYALTPILAHGWEHWVHENWPDKPYYRATQPGSKVQFEIETSVGIVKVYSLFAHDMGLGMCKCWVDDNAKDGQIIDGRWGNEANIGQLTTLAHGLKPGKHVVTCEVLKETNDPDGGTEFRIIGVMGG